MMITGATDFSSRPLQYYINSSFPKIYQAAMRSMALAAWATECITELHSWGQIPGKSSLNTVFVM